MRVMRAEPGRFTGVTRSSVGTAWRAYDLQLAVYAALLATVGDANDGENTTPVRIFTVAYGSGANPAELKRIAEASNAGSYQATDATTINDVFTSVISNF